MVKKDKKFAKWNGFIIIGIILIVIGVGYEAINYPWRNFGYKLGIVSLDENFPEPKDLLPITHLLITIQ